MNTITKLFRNILPKRLTNRLSTNTDAHIVDDTQILFVSNENELHRNLQERHMIMIALGGTIGTGLFLASGQALASAGPAGALISYLTISVMVYFVMTSLGTHFNFLCSLVTDILASPFASSHILSS
jgi:amino acid permease